MSAIWNEKLKAIADEIADGVPENFIRALLVQVAISPDFQFRLKAIEMLMKLGLQPVETNDSELSEEEQAHAGILLAGFLRASDPDVFSQIEGWIAGADGLLPPGKPELEPDELRSLRFQGYAGIPVGDSQYPDSDGSPDGGGWSDSFFDDPDATPARQD